MRMRSPNPAFERVDLAVIGGGSGGLSVAAGAAQFGLKVALFERGEMGGDCLNTGCVPSKALISAGKRAHAMRTAAKFGIGNVDPKIAWDKVRAHVHGVIAAIAPIDSQERFEGLGCRVIREHARFADPKTIVSATARVQARRIVVAAGGSALVPPIPGLRDVPYLTNESVFHLDTLPSHLLVLGGGPIGLELAQSFARLGSQVTVIEAGRCLGRDDREAADLVVGALRAEGVAFREGWKAVEVSQGVEQIEVRLQGLNGTHDVVVGSHLLVAVGRRVNVEGLDLEAGNVAFDEARVLNDAYLRSPSNKRVWVVGDIAGREKFTHTAGWHASVFVRNALFKAKTRADSSPMPHATYTDPELAQVGLTEAAAKERLGEKAVTVTRWAFHENDRAQAERAAEGFGKLVVGKGGAILGATLVGEGAGDLIQLVTLAMANKLPVKALTNYIAPYPTRGELIKRMAGAYYTPWLFSGKTRALVSILQRL